MSPSEYSAYRPRSIVTALVLLALGFSCLWAAESSDRQASTQTRARAVAEASGTPASPR